MRYRKQGGNLNLPTLSNLMKAYGRAAVSTWQFVFHRHQDRSRKAMVDSLQIRFLKQQSTSAQQSGRHRFTTQPGKQAVRQKQDQPKDTHAQKRHSKQDDTTRSHARLRFPKSVRPEQGACLPCFASPPRGPAAAPPQTPGGSPPGTETPTSLGTPFLPG